MRFICIMSSQIFCIVLSQFSKETKKRRYVSLCSVAKRLWLKTGLSCSKRSWHFYSHFVVANPELELGAGVVLLAPPSFLPFVISSFFTQNKGGPRPLAYCFGTYKGGMDPLLHKPSPREGIGPTVI